MPQSPNSGLSGRSILSPVRLVASLGLSLAVLVLIGIYTFEPDQFEHLVGRLNGWWLVAALVAVGLRVVFGGWRLAYASDGHLRLADGIRAQLAWDFFSNVTPSAIGGGPVAALYISRDRSVPLGQATAIMLFSMLLDQALFTVSIIVLMISALFLEVFPESIGAIGGTAFGILFFGMLVWLVLLSYAVLYKPAVLESVAHRVFRLRLLQRFYDRAMDEVRQLRHRAHILRAQPARFYLKGLAISLLLWITRYVLPLLIIRSVFLDLDAALIFFRTIALSLGSVILPTPGGSGGVEGLYALFLGPLMPATLVAPTLLAWRILGYYIFLALGVYLSMHQVQQNLRRNRRRIPVDAESSGGNRAVAEELAESVRTQD